MFINSIQYAVKIFQLQHQQRAATGLAEGQRGGTGSDVRVSFIRSKAEGGKPGRPSAARVFLGKGAAAAASARI